ncbi:hypothetical protein FORC31_p360 (plasmid) [Escherichia coli]|nr:hypothetical protein FORC31_p360 [Escherichia coli]
MDRPLTDFGGEVRIFIHLVYLFLWEFSHQELGAVQNGCRNITVNANMNH